MPAISQKLIGFGVGTIENIDPNPDNFVSAAIINTRSQQVGCLLRLEPNRQAEVRSLSQKIMLPCSSKTRVSPSLAMVMNACFTHRDSDIRIRRQR